MNEIDMISADNWDDTEIPEAEETPETETDQIQETETPAESEAPTDQYELKHLDETRTVGREEVVALAQKGMDYDRIREKYDSLSTVQKDYNDLKAAHEALNDRISYLDELAKSQNMTLDQMIDQTKAAILAKEKGMDMNAALEQVRLDRRDRELTKRENKLKAQKETEDSAQAEAAKRQADIQRFLKEYPDVPPKDIPKEVWAQVSKGSTLTEAYAKHEAAQLKLQLEAERKNKENRETSTGSRSNTGTEKKDPWAEGWDD